MWYDGTAIDAARFYAEDLSRTARWARSTARPATIPDGKQGDVLTVEFTVIGIPCIGLNGGPQFKHSEAFSFQVAHGRPGRNRPPVERDRRERRPGAQCGWCKDKWGLSWQITPRALTAAIADPDRAAAKRVFEAMMTMQKIDIATIEAARKG